MTISMLVVCALMWSCFAGALAIHKNRGLLRWMLAGLTLAVIPVVALALLPSVPKLRDRHTVDWAPSR
jgi:hypothetical protein